MANGNFVRAAKNGKGSVVFGPTVYDVPLLPFEKQLIATIGVTEEEYQRFTAEAKRRGVIRPAAYDHIPDIQNAILGSGAAIASAYLTTTAAKSATTVVLTNLAIGVTLTGISYLLTPKPKMPRAKGGGAIDLGSVTGASRFTPSRGFETIAELADYASPIPLIFGLYKDDIGGMLTTPKLIWSRMFSHGTMQRAKLMFVVGEQGVGSAGIQPPELEGIFLGNNPLDTVFKDLFAFYWHGDSSTSDKYRIIGSDKRYGTKGKSHRGDPDVQEDDSDVFVFPVQSNDKELNDGDVFCHAFSPSNSSEFGVYSAIANGTNYRVNYQLIPISTENLDNKAIKSQILRRMKVVGESGNVDADGNDLRALEKNPGDADFDKLTEIRKKNQAGAGRNYSPRMGIIEYTRTATETTAEEKITLGEDDGAILRIDNVAVDDEIKFRISNTSIPANFYQKKAGEKDALIGATVDDINTSVQSFQTQADDVLQPGEHFEIGGNIWKVTKRTETQFIPLEKDGDDQTITLRCVDTSTSVNKKIGIVSNSKVVSPTGSGNAFIGDSVPEANNSVGVGESFFPITKVEIASIKNNRPSISTEFGLKSTVFQRLNGLCNFQSLPTPEELNDAEEESVQMNNGSISSVIRRSSVFRIFVRDTDSDNPFVPLSRFFVVRGQQPNPQYNYIRITAATPLTLEYKFVPVSGSEMRAEDNVADAQFIVLSQSFSTATQGSVGNFVDFTEQVGAYSLSIRVSGIEYSGKDTFLPNKEFTRGGKTTLVPGALLDRYPTNVTLGPTTPAFEIGDLISRGSNLIIYPQGGGSTDPRNIANPGVTKGKLAPFFYALAGTPAANLIDKDEVEFTSKEFIDGTEGNWIHVRWKLHVKTNTAEVQSASGETKGWRLASNYSTNTNGVEIAVAKNDAIKVIASGSGFYEQQTLEIKRGLEATNLITGKTGYPLTGSNANPYADVNNETPITFSGLKVVVQSIDQDQKIPARRQALLYEVLAASPYNLLAENLNVGDPATARLQITAENGQKTIDVTFVTDVISLDPPVCGQSKGWSGLRIDDSLTEGSSQIHTGDDGITTTNWNVGDKFTLRRTVSTGNPFKTIYERVGLQYEIGGLTSKRDNEQEIVEADLFFAQQTQVADISAYRDLVEKSNNNGPEHQIVYINEAQSNDSTSNFSNLTIAGLSLKASRNFTALDQMRCWLGSGLPVERLHQNANGNAYGDTDEIGPSNLFTDLVYFLLTDQQAGAGALLGMDRKHDYLVDKNDLKKTSRFLETQKLFFNGPIVERTNLRQFISDMAPYFLCNFIISDGKFSLKPAVPASTGGAIDDGAVQVDQLFTSGNILEDTYRLEYLGAEERRAFKAVVRYRKERKNKLPEEQVVIVKGADGSGDFSSPGVNLLPTEQFDLTQFCTSEDHAVKVAKYFLALRAHVTHTISFSTTAEGLNIQAGSYIKVVTESSPYSAANTGTINSSGAVTSVVDMPNGSYDVFYFKIGNDDIEEGTMTVSDNTVISSTFHDIVFTVRNTSVSENIYIVEQLTFSQEGIVDIVASEHPCNADGSSKIAVAVNSDDGFSIES